MSDHTEQHTIDFPGGRVVAGEQSWPLESYGREVTYDTVEAGPVVVPDPAWVSSCRACGRVHEWSRPEPGAPPMILGAHEVPSPVVWCPECRDHHPDGRAEWRCECGFRVVPVWTTVTTPPARMVREDTTTVTLTAPAHAPATIEAASIVYDGEGVTHSIVLPAVMTRVSAVVLAGGAAEPQSMVYAGPTPVA